MSYADQLDAIRDNIRQIESHHTDRRSIEAAATPRNPVDLHVDGLPDLPPRLPRPDYTMRNGLLGQSDAELQFYAACENGVLELVQSFLQTNSANKAMLQFGLEAASFAIQPEIARHLLQQGAVLHDGVFVRSWPNKIHQEVCLFDPGKPDPLPMAQLFLEFGWHPNQLWNRTNRHGGGRDFHLLLLVVRNEPLLALLLSHGAHPCLSHINVDIHDDQLVNRRCGYALTAAAAHGVDRDLLAMLVEHGADPTFSHPLHSIATWQGRGTFFKRGPFSIRRATAEYLVSSNISGINEIKLIEFSDNIQANARRENIPPFVYACAAQDWEFAEWLLENGADPFLANGRAFEPMMFSYPDRGPSDPAVVMELVTRVKYRQGPSAHTDVQTDGSVLE